MSIKTLIDNIISFDSKEPKKALHAAGHDLATSAVSGNHFRLTMLIGHIACLAGRDDWSSGFLRAMQTIGSAAIAGLEQKDKEILPLPYEELSNIAYRISNYSRNYIPLLPLPVHQSGGSIIGITMSWTREDQSLKIQIFPPGFASWTYNHEGRTTTKWWDAKETTSTPVPIPIELREAIEAFQGAEQGTKYPPFPFG